MSKGSTAEYDSRNTEKSTALAGRYVYCLSDGGSELVIGQIGLEGSEVYTVAYKDICAVVHDCPPQLYYSQDQEVIENWVLVHESAVETAWKRFGTVLPFGFDTIIKGEDSDDAEKQLRNWLENNYGPLRDKVDELKGKAEYVAHIFWESKIASKKVAEIAMELKQVERELASDSEMKGRAYLQKQKLERILKKEMELQAEKLFRKFYSRLEKHADQLKIEKPKKIDEKEILMKLACLVQDSKAKGLSDELKDIESLENFSVRVTGPWPPYSFVD